MKNIQNTNHITDRLNKTHLAVTVLEKGTGLAITKMPIYAEVSTQYIQLPYLIQFLRDKYFDLVRATWGDLLIVEVNDLVNTLISKYFPIEKIILTIPDNGKIPNLTKLGKALLETENDSIPFILTSNSLPAEYQKDKSILTEKLISFIVDFYKRNQKKYELAEFKDNSILQQYSYPLGFLATDHVGYASYNIENILQTINSINRTGELKIDYLIYPLGLDANKISLSKLSLDNRITQEVIFAKLEIERPEFENDHTSLNLPSMQNPSLADWYMSAGSFASQPNALLGEDGCETLLPSNLSLHQYNFYQVVRATKAESDAFFDKTTVTANDRTGLHLGYIDQYKTSWYSIGHSLGQILYSLPLAPGETVKLAVIDWSNETKKSRFEDTQTSEFLSHETHRDRIITEIVTASVDEWQRGGSVMGGISQLVGGAAMMGPLAGAVGLGMSLGGGYATSSGDRDLRAENVQKLNDNFSQTSSVQRELNSTVVVQARQEEKESIQTRTFSNYNHSHTLTILYYEILRHFRVVTEWTNRVPAILIKTDNSTLYGTKVKKNIRQIFTGKISSENHVEKTFRQIEESVEIENGVAIDSKLNDNDYVLKYKSTLEKNLLNPDFIDSLKAFERQKHRENFVKNYPKYKETERKFKYFNIEIGVGGMSRANKGSQDVGFKGNVIVFASIFDTDGFENQLYSYKETLQLNIEGAFSLNEFSNQIYALLQKPITWSEISNISISIILSDVDISISSLSVIGFDDFGIGETLFQKKFDSGHIIIGGESTNKSKIIAKKIGDSLGDALTLNLDDLLGLGVGDLAEDVIGFFTGGSNQDPKVPKINIANLTIPLSKAPLKIAISPEETEDLTKIEDLKAHLIANADYYDKIIQLNKSQYEIVKEFEVSPQHDFLLDNVVPTPIAIHGSYIAYPLNSKIEIQKPKLSEKDKKSEKLITLPTRGVFAEGKLGHCNISEVIDNTRFWKWEKHPIPIQAPEIGTTTPITPAPQTITVEPSTVPTTISIQQPTPAPDPQGLAGALQAIVQGNMFRDMSMQAHVTDLLKNLNDNTAKVAQTAADMLKPAESKKKEGENTDNSGESEPSQTGSKPSSASSNSKQAQPQQTEAQKESDRINNAKNLTKLARKLPAKEAAKILQTIPDKVSQKPTNKNPKIIFRFFDYIGHTINCSTNITIHDDTLGTTIVRTIPLDDVQQFQYSTNLDNYEGPGLIVCEIDGTSISSITSNNALSLPNNQHLNGSISKWRLRDDNKPYIFEIRQAKRGEPLKVKARGKAEASAKIQASLTQKFGIEATLETIAKLTQETNRSVGGEIGGGIEAEVEVNFEIIIPSDLLLIEQIQ